MNTCVDCTWYDFLCSGCSRRDEEDCYREADETACNFFEPEEDEIFDCNIHGTACGGTDGECPLC